MTERLTSILPDAIARAAACLRQGGLVALPTETVYGLGADARNDHAVARIFAAKGRPSFNPLIVHLPDAAQAFAYGSANDWARVLADAFWPGPLSLVLPRIETSGLSRLVSAGLPSVALRVPAHPVAQDLLRAFGGPIAAPSANPSGRISATTAQHVLDHLGDAVDLVLDAGPCQVGLESTVVDVTGAAPTLLRPGGIPVEAIEEALRRPLARAGSNDAAPASPGMLTQHYAPQARVRLNAAEKRPEELFLGFGGTPGATLDLSPSGDLVEAAANLFAHLHKLDEAGTDVIAVAPIPETGLGLAINDRLRRAAAGR